MPHVFAPAQDLADETFDGQSMLDEVFQRMLRFGGGDGEEAGAVDADGVEVHPV